MDRSRLVLQRKRLLTRLRRKSGALGFLRRAVPPMVGAFLLTGTGLLRQPLPLAAGFVAAFPTGCGSIFAALGAVGGYILRCESTPAAMFTALTVLLLAAVGIFRVTNLPSTRWFLPVIASSVCAVLGSVCLLGGNETELAFWAADTLLAGLSAAGFRSAAEGNRTASAVLAACVVSGLGSAPFPAELGLFAAALLAAGCGELLPAAVIGLTLELSGNGTEYLTGALLLPQLFASCTHDRRLRAAGTALLPPVLLLCFGTPDALSLLALAGGGLAGWLLGSHRALFAPLTADEASAVTARLEQGASLLELVEAQFPVNAGMPMQEEAERVYDGAADHICRCCARFHKCWQQNAEESYQLLAGAARPILERGNARKEDFPQEFRSNCCHIDGFVMAVNQELEGMLYRRRFRMQLLESRRVIAQEYDCIAQYLRALSEPQRQKRPSFEPDVGIATVAKRGNRVIGDRCRCFSERNARYYAMLCDGMGSGEEAARISTETLELLEKLLRAGLDGEAALRLLNGAALLRDEGAYATVDLLELDLSDGTGVLYKWGSAPSYLGCGAKRRTLGRQTPPPGFFGEARPERFELALGGGLLLTLASDGAEQAAELIRSYQGSSPRELAALLTAGMPSEDDKTALCLRLYPKPF